MARIYSKIDSIPRGQASESLIDGCLVLEGGAFRGLYTAGFLDAMMLNGLNLSCVAGVSAGTICGMNYVSGQIGRSARTNLTFRHDSRYVGAKALLHSHSLIDVGFLTEDRGINPEPLDEQRFYRPQQRFIVAATNCLRGRTVYFEKNVCGDIMTAIRASSSMPYVSQEIMIDGEPYLDGGCSCSIPYKWALEQGFGKIIVVKTRDIYFRKPEEISFAAIRFYHHKYPLFAETLSMCDIRYNRQCDEIERLHAEGKLLRFAPSENVTVSRVESDMEKLGELYWLGYNDCTARLAEIRGYLGV